MGPRKPILLFFAVLGFCSCGRKLKDSQKVADRPNVIYINVDDLGWKDVGFMGGDFFETPYMDALAKEGIVFGRSYSAAANCAPSRACLMTGRNTPWHGVYTVSPSARGSRESRKLVPIKNTDSLLLQDITLAELFKMAGYATGIFGKWHLGNDPTQQGFDVNVGGSLRGNPGVDGYFSPYNKLAGLKDGPVGENLTDRLTQEALRFIVTNKERPFFVYLSFYAVHTPLQAKEELVTKYGSRSNPKDIEPTYAAMVETVDQNVGKLMRELKNMGLEENTIVIFTSDNGGIRDIATQDPLRAGKGSYYEGGIRVPCIIKWLGTVKGARTDEPITNLDFFPTFMELLEIDLPDHRSDGKSILPLLRGNAMERRPLFWHFPIYLEAYNPKRDEGRDPLFRTRPGSVVMLGDWKLHYYFEDNGTELYNLKEDVGERHNLVNIHPRKVEELMVLLRNWQKETNAPIPVELNPHYAPKNENH